MNTGQAGNRAEGHPGRFFKVRQRPKAVVGLVLLLAAVFVGSACGGPSTSSNAFALHVVAPSCDIPQEDAPLLTVEKVVGGVGKATITEWHSMEKLDGCGVPFDGHDWDGDVLQVWVSDYVWGTHHHAQVQMGNRIENPHKWAMANDAQLRLDWSHLFLGTVDMTDNGEARFVPGTKVASSYALLKDRQGCEPGPPRNGLHCQVEEWEQADRFTFEAVDASAETADVGQP